MKFNYNSDWCSQLCYNGVVCFSRRSASMAGKFQCLFIVPIVKPLELQNILHNIANFSVQRDI